jgi:galactose mutarotase-like enzyme
MPELTRQHGLPVWTLASLDGHTSASIVPELGGVVSSLCLPAAGGSRDCLFRHPFFWDPASTETRGGIPFLFPICGRLQREGRMGEWQHEGRPFRLPIHGFAMRRPWVVLDHRRPDELVLGQIDGEDTLAAYPFHFELLLRYRVMDGRFRCEQTYTNRGREPMPFSAGFHPYFLTPPARTREGLTVEVAASRRRCYDATYTAFAGEAPPAAAPISLEDPLFSDAVHQVAGACRARVRWPDGFAVDVSGGGVEEPHFFPYLQCYATADDPFVCVEPWTGVPNALNTGDGLRWLAPGEVARAWFEVAEATPHQPG